MIKRFTLAALTVAMLLALAVPAAAKDSGGAIQTCLGLYETRTQDIPGEGPVEIPGYWVPLEYDFGGEVVVEDLAIQSLAGCATTVRRGGGELPVPFTALSTLAINSQCRLIEGMGVEYPYDFYGNPAYHAENRADCIFFLRSFHLGTLPPGGGPE